MLKKFIEPLTSLFIVGESTEEVVEKAKRLNADGFKVTISYLAEYNRSVSQAAFALKKYKALIRKIAKEKVDANVAIKLSAFKVDHFGYFSTSISVRYLLPIFDLAKEREIFIWIDMEDPASISEVLRTYRVLAKEYDIGVALQTSMRRTLKDIAELPKESCVRLCKGAYRGPRSTMHKSQQKIFYNFLECLKLAYSRLNFAVATHDDRIIDIIVAPVEFQFLYGVNFEKATKLKNKGRQVLIYLPYGENRYNYCIRRLKENPKLIISLLWRAAFSKIKGSK